YLAQYMLKAARSSAEEQEKMFNWDRHSFWVSRAELSRENQALQATNAELLTEQSDLKAEVNILLALVDHLEQELAETTGKCNKMNSESMKEQGTPPLPYSQNNLMILRNNKEFPMYEEAFKCNANLDEDDLQVYNLLCNVRELEEKLFDTEKTCDALKQEKEQEQKAHHTLKIQNGALKYRIMACIKMLLK
ncbi:leucine-rich repeat flightless-interacting protein 2-like, partial [Clarias magur]